MYRNAQVSLEQWFKNKNRKPLVIRGARQVGKSTLVEQFAKKHRIPLTIVNLERHQRLNSIFESNDPDKIIAEIESLPNVSPLQSGGILFLDEIQATPLAIAALRYFYEEKPEIAIVAAGSLLEFVLSKANFSMPVGRIQYLHMHPMGFEEFLIALGASDLLAKDTEIAHTRLLEYQRIFCFVGGMPEAVATYCDSKNFNQVRAVQNAILETYQDDFPKYSQSRKLGRMQRVFEYVALHAGEKVKYSNIDPAEQSRTLKGDLRLLILARIITPVYHTNCACLPLKIGKNENVFKLFFLDVGLMNAVAELDWRHIKRMSERDLVNEGAIAEQFVAQMLLLSKPFDVSSDLFYWQRDGKSGNAEVDFVESRNKSIIPIEVKAGNAGRLRSLQEFVKHTKTKKGIRFDLNRATTQVIEIENVKFALENRPLYQVTSILNELEADDGS